MFGEASERMRLEWREALVLFLCGPFGWAVAIIDTLDHAWYRFRLKRGRLDWQKKERRREGIG